MKDTADIHTSENRDEWALQNIFRTLTEAKLKNDYGAADNLLQEALAMAPFQGNIQLNLFGAYIKMREIRKAKSRLPREKIEGLMDETTAYIEAMNQAYRQNIPQVLPTFLSSAARQVLHITDTFTDESEKYDDVSRMYHDNTMHQLMSVADGQGGTVFFEVAEAYEAIRGRPPLRVPTRSAYNLRASFTG